MTCSVRLYSILEKMQGWEKREFPSLYFFLVFVRRLCYNKNGANEQAGYQFFKEIGDKGYLTVRDF